jgi:hypothetical protein
MEKLSSCVLGIPIGLEGRTDGKGPYGVVAKASDQPTSLKERNDEGSAVFPVAVQSELLFLVPHSPPGERENNVYNELCCCLVISS